VYSGASAGVWLRTLLTFKTGMSPATEYVHHEAKKLQEYKEKGPLLVLATYVAEYNVEGVFKSAFLVARRR
jgi:hypothetical protein